MSAKEKKKKRLSGRFAVFITLLLFVCTIIFLNNQFSSGSLRRLSYWIFNGVRGDASEASISFDANDYNRFKTLNGNLCVISPEKLSAYKLSGKVQLSEPVLLRSPAVDMSKSRFIAYDLGGLNFYIANNKKLLYSGACEAQILNVNMNEAGDFAIITDDADCKSLVTVYNSKFEVVYKYHSSEKYVFDTAVSPNGKACAIAGYGTNEGNFEASVSLGKTNEKSFYANISLGSSMPLDITYQSDSKILVICNDRAIICNSDGEVVNEIPFNSLPVKAFANTYGKHTAVLLDNYQNGGNSRILLIKSNGETATLDIEQDVYSISSAGSYIALQFSDKCVVYKNDLTVDNEFIIPSSIISCIVNNDGSVLAVGESSATLYVE